MDLYTAEDALHQTMYQDHLGCAGPFNMDLVCKTLLSHVDIDTNIDCTKKIFEILFTMLGCQDSNNPVNKVSLMPTRLMLSEY